MKLTKGFHVGIKKEKVHFWKLVRDRVTFQLYLVYSLISNTPHFRPQSSQFPTRT